MNINVFGLGYVGTTVSVMLAYSGHRVVGIDIVPEKIDRLNQGFLHILEPELDRYFQTVLDNKSKGQFRAFHQTELKRIDDVSIICVGTPSLSSGEVDLLQIEETVTTIGTLLGRSNKKHDVIVKCHPAEQS